MPDLSTVSLAADRIARVNAPTPYLLHAEFESGKDTADVPFCLLEYSVAAKRKFKLPVASVVFPLHRASDSTRITGAYEEFGADGQVTSGSATEPCYRTGMCEVWQEDGERLLTGGRGLLPLAPIANVAQAELPAIIRRS